MNINLRQMFRSLALAYCLAVAMIIPTAMAEGVTPVIPDANARFSPDQGCVEPTDDMRKNHMNYILHERDETMYEGIRGSRYSLAECINCHVPKRSGGNKVRVDSDEHFCSSCHPGWVSLIFSFC